MFFLACAVQFLNCLDSASLFLVKELNLLRDDIDNAGLPFQRTLSMIAAFEYEQANVGQ